MAKLREGHKTLTYSRGDLLKEWDYSKNNNISPSDFGAGSHKKVWWLCGKKHSYLSSICDRCNGCGCPYCANRKVLSGYNDLATVNPKVASEWHPTKNGALQPTDVAANAHKKVWWLCRNNHSYFSAISGRSRGSGCPYCTNKTVLAGYNDLSTANPKVASEWHPTKNGTLQPTDVTANSSKKVWWLCNNNHSYFSSISGRNGGHGCPYCTNQKVLIKYNDLATTNPEVASEWHPTKNGTLRPTDVVAKSNKKVWWLCRNNHSYLSSIHSRSDGRGCPYCANRKILTGYNDLATVNPVIASEWHPTKNGALRPTDLATKSHKMVWWLCDNNHSYRSSMYNRSSGHGCPYCTNKKVLTGYNDLATVNPAIASEWHPTKNGTLQPTDVAAKSSKKVWWLGKCGHEWSAVIWTRVENHGCPFCAKELTTSFPEQALFYYIKKIRADTINGDRDALGIELDIYIPSIKTAVEYDGYKWHCNNKKVAIDQKKDLLCRRAGISLIRVREKGLAELKNCICIFRDGKDDESLDMAIKNVLNLLGDSSSTDVDTSRDSVLIQSNYLSLVKENSIANTALIKEWDYEKNSDLRPEFISVNSNKNVWWRCSKQHEWQSTPYSRKKTGCPYCSNHRVLTSFNDLATTNPSLAAEWSDKNKTLKPTDVTRGSNKKVWWKCSNGHDYTSTVGDRNAGKACPYCANKKLLTGYNDIKTVRPAIAKFWHPTKNLVSPNEVIRSSGKKCWWKCPDCGYEWRTAPAFFHGCKMCGIARRAKAASKPVLCVETGTIYRSVAEAQKLCKVNHISDCCAGNRNTTGGYHWKFI